MMTSDDKVGGWVKKGQNHDDVILECPLIQNPPRNLPGQIRASISRKKIACTLDYLIIAQYRISAQGRVFFQE